MSIYPSFDLPPAPPPVPAPWNIHRREHSSMEQFTEHPLEDPDSPMEDAPPIEPAPTTYYLPDSPEGHTHTLSPGEPPIKPWKAYLTQPNSPVSRKHLLLPTSPASVPICQYTSREGSYQSIMPTASSPVTTPSIYQAFMQLSTT